MKYQVKHEQPFSMGRQAHMYQPTAVTEAEHAIFPFYYDTCAALDPILSKLTTDQASLEALNSNIFGRLFVSIADTFVGLLNTFKTNAFKFTKTLKRSEIREFVESNRMKTSVVNGLPITDKLLNFGVDIPANMEGTFKVAADALSNIYVKINAKGTAQAALSGFNEILKGLTANDANTPVTVRKTSQLILAVVKATKPVVLECQKKYSGTFVMKRPYKDAYQEPKQFKEVTQQLIDMEGRLQDARSIIEMVEQIETVLKGICDAAGETTVVLSNKDVIDLGEAAKGLALLFDSYGMAATRQMALEHNHILNINNIFAKVK